MAHESTCFPLSGPASGQPRRLNKDAAKNPQRGALPVKDDTAMANFQDTFLSGANIDFIEGLYARYLEDPASVDASWREVF